MNWELSDMIKAKIKAEYEKKLPQVRKECQIVMLRIKELNKQIKELERKRKLLLKRLPEPYELNYEGKLVVEKNNKRSREFINKIDKLKLLGEHKEAKKMLKELLG